MSFHTVTVGGSTFLHLNFLPFFFFFNNRVSVFPSFPSSLHQTLLSSVPCSPALHLSASPPSQHLSFTMHNPRPPFLPQPPSTTLPSLHLHLLCCLLSISSSATSLPPFILLHTCSILSLFSPVTFFLISFSSWLSHSHLPPTSSPSPGSVSQEVLYRGF